MTHKIPNTNLELSDSEINAVVEFAYNNRNGNGCIEAKEEEFEIPEKYRGTCKKGYLKEIYGNNIPVPEFITYKEGKNIND